MNKTILIIDDDPDYKESTQTMLESKNYSVITASNGDEGIAKAKSEKPDLVILDVMMQYDSEGLDTAVKFRDDEELKKIPLILATGIKKPEFLTDSYDNQASWTNLKGVFEKPFKPDELLVKIESALS